MYKIILGRNKSDREKFNEDGTIFLGKHYVTMGTEKSLANPVLLDIARPHVMLICGKRGSGKSYTLGVIAEELSNLPEKIKENLSGLIFDTLGIFWSMKYENYRDEELLKKWNLKSAKKDIIIFVPKNMQKKYEEQGIPIDYEFSLKTSFLNAEDWCNLFEINLNSEKGALISWALSNFKEEFSINELLEKIKENQSFSKEQKKELISRFETVLNWQIFDKKGIDIEKLLVPGRTTVLDISAYAQFAEEKIIKNLVIDIISRQILKKRMIARKEEEIEEIQTGNLFSERVKQEPLIWILIDEAHEFIPKKETLSSKALKSILKEGRQPGISLVMATQQVGKLHSDALSQADIVLSHRVTSKKDILALQEIMQSYISKDLILKLKELPNVKGSAIVLDDKNEKIFPIQIRPRQSWHGGNDPSAIKKIKEHMKKEKRNPFLERIESKD